MSSNASGKDHSSQPTVQYQFNGIEDATKETVRLLVQKNLFTKLDLFLKYIYNNHPDAKVLLQVSLKKDSTSSFAGSFLFVYPSAKGQQELAYQREGFNDLLDLINHAFQHFKLQISDSSQQESEHHVDKIKEIPSGYGKNGF